MNAEQLVKQGNLAEGLSELQASIRKDAGDAKARVFLFQLLSVMGQWERALTQLGVVSEMDASTLPMAQTYREAIQCELFRADVFAGARTPLIFGEPPEWMALMLEALRATGAGEHQQARAVRERAFEQAPGTAGTLNGTEFAWIADADSRLGPVLEAIVNGNYYWIPFERIQTIAVEAPEDLRDVVWMPAQFTWANGGQTVGLIPTRYPGTEASEDDAQRLSRKTDWIDMGEELFFGVGQRLLSTDVDDYSLMDVREVVLATATTESGDSDA